MVAAVKRGVERCTRCGDRYKRAALVEGLCPICEGERRTKERRIKSKERRLAKARSDELRRTCGETSDRHRDYAEDVPEVPNAIRIRRSPQPTLP